MNVFSTKPPPDTACTAKRGPSSPLSVSSSPSKTRASGSTSVPSSMTISMSFGTQASPVVAPRSPLDLSHAATADLHNPLSPVAATTFKTEDCPKLRKAIEEGEEEMETELPALDGSPADQRPPTLAAGEGVVSPSGRSASPCSPASSRGSVVIEPLKKSQNATSVTQRDGETTGRRPRLNSISTATSPLTSSNETGQFMPTATTTTTTKKTPKTDDVSSQLQVLVDFLRSVAGRAEGVAEADGTTTKVLPSQAPTPPTPPPPPPPPPNSVPALPNPLNDVASSLLALFGGQKMTRVPSKPKETVLDMAASISPQPSVVTAERCSLLTDLPASRDLLFQLGQQLMALAATSGGTPSASVPPVSKSSASLGGQTLTPNILPDIMMLSPPLAVPKTATNAVSPASSGFNEANRGDTPVWMSSRGSTPSAITSTAGRQSSRQAAVGDILHQSHQPTIVSTINTTHTPTEPTPQPPTLSGISMRGNQKYSAFYQHHRKQALNVPQSNLENPDEGFLRGQSTNIATRVGGVGFPGGRRCNGPSNRGDPAPLGAARFSGTASAGDNLLLKSTTSARLSTPISPEGVPAGLSGSMPTLSSSRCSRETAFMCSCGEDFDSLYVFTLHMKNTGHKPRSSQPDRDIPKLVRGQDMWINSETEQTREILRCMRCNQSFRSLPELTMHMMKTNHYSEIVYSDAGRNLLASQTLSSVGGDASRADKGRSSALSGASSAGAGSLWATGGVKYPCSSSYRRAGRSISASTANGTGTLHGKASLTPTGPPPPPQQQQTSRSEEESNLRGSNNPLLSNEPRPASPRSQQHYQQSSPAKAFKLEHNHQLSCQREGEEEGVKGEEGRPRVRDSEETAAEPCRRPASSHELQIKSPKPIRSPDTYSCPSTLQHVDEGENKIVTSTPSPGKDNSEGESKYSTGAGEVSHSPSSSRGTTSPQCGDRGERPECDTADMRRSQCCSDSVIRQIESFVEKSLPYPAISSPAKTNWHRSNSGANSLLKGIHTTFGGLFPRPTQSPIGSNCYEVPSLEPTRSSSNPDRIGQRKRRYSSGSSSSTTATPSVFSGHLPTEELTSVTEKGRTQLFDTPTPCDMAENSTILSASENPLSSLQKLVETTHQASNNAKNLGSPLRPSFSSFGSGVCQAGDKANSASPANLSHTPTSEIDPLKLTLPAVSTGVKPPTSQAGLASAISALYSYMSKASSMVPRNLPTPPKTIAAPVTSDTTTASSTGGSGESALFPTPDMKLLADLIALQGGGGAAAAGGGALTSDLEQGTEATQAEVGLARDLPPAWLGLLTMVLNAAAKQSGLQMLSKNWPKTSSEGRDQGEPQDTKSDIRPLGMLDVTATSLSSSVAAAAAVAAIQSQFLQPPGAFGQPAGVLSFSNSSSCSGASNFGLPSPAFQAVPGRGPRASGGLPNTSLSLPVHMSTAAAGGASVTTVVNSSSMVANITKKAKCHFCGKPFANKGQVRLHISKNKCPCLLQQSCHAAAMAKASLMRTQVSVASSVAAAVAAAATASSSPLTSNKRPATHHFSPLFSGFSGAGKGNTGLGLSGDFSQFFTSRATQKDLHMHQGQQVPQSQSTTPQQNTSDNGGNNPHFTDQSMESSLPTEAAALELLLRHLQFPTQQTLLSPATSRQQQQTPSQQQQQQQQQQSVSSSIGAGSLNFPLPDVQALAGFKPTDLLATLARAAAVDSGCTTRTIATVPVTTTASGTVAAPTAFENPLGSNSLLTFLTGQVAAAAAAAAPPQPPPPPPPPPPVQNLEAALTPEQKALFLFAQAVASLSSGKSIEEPVPKNPNILPSLIQTFGFMPPSNAYCSDSSSGNISSLLTNPAVPPALETLSGLNPDLLNSYLNAIRKIAASGNVSKNSSDVTTSSANTRTSAAASTASQSDDTDSR
uniref:C2H2-type domain-containing protein n=1 Tax=Schistocephalus solidus TaxID=70667 RepID=A0A0X3PQJ2_SCHSO